MFYNYIILIEAYSSTKTSTHISVTENGPGMMVNYTLQYSYVKILTAFEADDPPSSASTNFLFLLNPLVANAVEFAVRFRINSSSSCGS